MQRLVSRALIAQRQNLRANWNLIFRDLTRQKDRCGDDLWRRPPPNHFEGTNRRIDYLTVRLHEPNRIADMQSRTAGLNHRAGNQNATTICDLECIFNDEQKRWFHAG